MQANVHQPGRFRGAQDMYPGRCMKKPYGGICVWVVKDTCPLARANVPMYPSPHRLTEVEECGLPCDQPGC